MPKEDRTETVDGVRPPSSLPPSRYAHRVRVRYAECDPMGVAHHGSYAVWLEEARTEMLRVCGVAYAAMEAAGHFLVVTRMETTFRRPLRYDDVVEVRVVATPQGRTRLRHSYELALIERGGREPDPSADASVPIDGVCAVASTELACVNASGRPQAMPDWLLGRGEPAWTPA